MSCIADIDMCYSFIQELRATCLKTKPGNKPFWDAVKGVGRPLSYITDVEASKAGGTSNFSESAARKVGGPDCRS